MYTPLFDEIERKEIICFISNIRRSCIVLIWFETNKMNGSMLFIFGLSLMIAGVYSYGCSCSCCTGTGCSVAYLGTVSVSTCASTTCSDACKANYTACLTGSNSAVCSATNMFQFHMILFLIISTMTFVLFAKY
jgi:hypothetical protein